MGQGEETGMDEVKYKPQNGKHAAAQACAKACEMVLASVPVQKRFAILASVETVVDELIRRSDSVSNSSKGDGYKYPARTKAEFLAEPGIQKKLDGSVPW